MFLKEYEKLRLIGKGAFASVYKVRHLNLGYVRALKVSHELIESEDDKSWQTFLNECRMLLRIGNGAHPNIVRIYQPRLLDNKAAVEMDYVEGLSLSEYIADNRFIPIDEFKAFATQIVGALAYCHVDIYRFMMEAEADGLEADPMDGRKFLISPEKRLELIEKYGVIHNDLHSNNIIRRDYDGQYILLDFGLAIQDDHCVKSSSRGDGAIEYTAPEKLDRNVVSKQSDVYSMGILLYEMLTGQVPFPCKGPSPESARAKVYMQHLNEKPANILTLRKQAFEETHPGEEYKNDLPEGLTDIVMKCLSKNPADRYADAKALQEALTECFEAKDAPVEQESVDVPVVHVEQSGQEEEENVSASISSEIEKRVREEVERLKREMAANQPPKQSPPTPSTKPSLIWAITWFILIVLGILFIISWRGCERMSDKTMEVQVAEEVAAEDAPADGVWFNVIDGMPYTEMVLVGGGTFTMGATEEQGSSDPYDDEYPTHEVTLSDYYIGKYEVTQGLWKYVMNYSGECADGSYMSAYSSGPWLGSNPDKGVGANYPAYYVSYKDIVDIFLPRLNRITGKKYCLPTEAEWEFAARGGNESREYKYSGSDTLSDVAWYGADWTSGSSHPVGKKTANELGLHDMSGNVWEWCADYYGSYSYSAQTNPTGPTSGAGRVYRGGGWNSVAQGCRVSNRTDDDPGGRYVFLGFRLACRQF